MEISSLLTSERGKSLFLPAHGRGAALPKALRNLLKSRCAVWDLPELPDLGGPLDVQGAVAISQRSSALAIGAEQGWYGVNGATGLLQAALLSIAKPGQGVLMPRNVHRSIIQACVLGDLVPVLFNLPFLKDRGHYLPPNESWLQEVLYEIPLVGVDIACAVLVNPTYHGYSSEIRPLVKLLHDHDWPVLVDEAHGTHFASCIDDDLPDSALAAGADLVVHSLHKSAQGLTQTAVIWLQGQRVDPFIVHRSISWLQTTSPNALLLASCEAALREWSHSEGRKRLKACLVKARAISLQLRKMGLPLLSNQDPLRLLLHTASVGISGLDADDWFLSRGLVAELPEPGSLTFCLGFGSHRGLTRLMKRTWDALLFKYQGHIPMPAFSAPKLPLVTKPEIGCGSAWRANSQLLPLKEAAGHISADLICPYPPGIPILIPGEVLDQERVDWLLEQHFLWPKQVSSQVRVVK